MVLVTVGAVIERAQFDATDVADAGHPAVVVGLDDDVGELRGIGQTAQGFDINLEGLGRSTGGCASTPAETWTFCARNAATTSPAVRSSAAILSGSSQMRMA